MPKVTFIEHDGTEHVVDAPVGRSVMQCAVDNMLPGIVGDCGGNCACATCHGFVDEPWLGKLTGPSEEETLMLEGALEVKPDSRLCCQILVTDELDGLRIRLPASQY